ncbi:hypothetical protein [Runella sp.]|uniref:hypothetical protein n=1 Tax=Runella sp. TaxID=1960881 RepID=UPI003D142BE4
MKIPVFILFWLYLSTFLAKESAETERAVVVVYRRKDYFSADFTIKINNQAITEKFSNNEYFRLEVPAGKVKVDTEGSFITEKKSMSFTINANETLFLKGIVDYDYLSNALYFKRTDSGEAAKEMNKLKLDETALKRIE